MATTKKDSDTGGGNTSYVESCIDLFDQALAALEARCRVEEPFSADLSGVVAPTLQALGGVRRSYVSALRREAKEMSAEAAAASEERLRSSSAQELLQAAVAAGVVPTGTEAGPAAIVRMENGARRIPWLEIVKEILELLLELLPFVPDFLKRILRELLKILDKIFGGIPHEDLGRSRPLTGD
jgi:hypothetical protein